ncbi:hypothetical protein Mic7113_0942 [Allocoleopsis franciscana PCC 7113]|uniref:Uncharacterized protein n=1 Tax=Allocoleopsis franciscana PCC 7113 TaxID=1173027 RepID=K9W8W2_9CYAN|nr:hypothetical protein Mic7113_0942 [Allocoleopsis franciscana PCC 7113]
MFEFWISSIYHSWLLLLNSSVFKLYNSFSPAPQLPREPDNDIEIKYITAYPSFGNDKIVPLQTTVWLLIEKRENLKSQKSLLGMINLPLKMDKLTMSLGVHRTLTRPGAVC